MALDRKDDDHTALEMDEKGTGATFRSSSSSPSLPPPASGSGSSGGAQDAKKKMHPAVIISLWIALSSAVIVYNKYILSSLDFKHPVFLTTFHLAFATVGTRLLHRFTPLLDGLRDVEMTWERWYKNILPIGALFSGSLVFSNMAYLTLSVSFIQMLKAFTPVAVLLLSFAFKLKTANPQLVWVVCLISSGVCVASYGELEFAFEGFVCQVLGILFESSRLVMIQVLLQGLKMDPLVSLYYFAPVCAGINGLLIPFTEGWAPFLDLPKLGPFVLLSNASVAFGLNVALVFLIGAASSLTLTLAGVFKDILLIVSSVVLLGSSITPLQVLGYGVALVGLYIFKTM